MRMYILDFLNISCYIKRMFTYVFLIIFFSHQIVFFLIEVSFTYSNMYSLKGTAR